MDTVDLSTCQHKLYISLKCNFNMLSIGRVDSRQVDG